MIEEHDLEERAEQFIGRNPGCTIEELRIRLNVSYAKASRIAQKLNHENKVGWTIDGRKKYLYTPPKRNMFHALLRPLTEDPQKRSVIEYLIEHRDAPQHWHPGRISRQVGFTYSRVNRMMKNLSEKEVLACRQVRGTIWEQGIEFTEFIQVAQDRLANPDLPIIHEDHRAVELQV